MPTPLQQLTAKIQKAVPDIISYHQCPCNGWAYQIRTFCEFCKDYNGSIPKYRSITSEDVLRALAKLREKTNRGYSIRHTGRIYSDNLSNVSDIYICSWKLGLPLHLQSEETIKSLNEIIPN